MRIRMKISYMALIKQVTIKEFILEAILNSYNRLNNAGFIQDPYPVQDDEFFQKILAGRADLKILLWQKVKGQPKSAADRKQFA